MKGTLEHPFSDAPKLETVSATSLDYIGGATLDLSQATIEVCVHDLRFTYPMDNPIPKYDDMAGAMKWVIKLIQVTTRSWQSTSRKGVILYYFRKADISWQGQIVALAPQEVKARLSCWL